MKLHIEGPARAEGGSEIAAWVEREFGERPRTLPVGAEAGAGKKTDPVAIAALILSLPGALLATADLAERLRLREKLGRLIALAKRLKEEKGVVVRAETKTGLRDLAAMDADQVIDAVDPGDQAEP